MTLKAAVRPALNAAERPALKAAVRPMLLAGLLGGCTTEEAAPPPPDEAMYRDAEAPPVVPPAPPEGSAAAGDGPVPVELMFFNVSALYQGFFSNPEAVAVLSEGLSGCLTENAQVRIAYDNETLIGRFVLKIPQDVLVCKPQVQDDGRVDLRPMEPVGRALAAYRASISSRFDLRVASFHTGVNFTRGATTSCDLWIGGEPPSDGRQWSPCVDFVGRPTCAAGDGDRGVVELAFGDNDATRALTECVVR